MSTSSNPSQPSLQLPRLIHWAVSHCRAAGNAIAGMKQQPISSLVAILMIGIAIALPACLHLFVETADQAAQQFQVVPTISLYLPANTSPKEATQLMSQIKQFRQVDDVQFISSQQGLQDFSNQTQLKDVLQHLKHNPLPAIIEVTPIKQQRNITALKTLQTQLQRISHVDMAQLDTLWVTRLNSFLQLGQRLSLILTGLFYLAVMLIVGNTIRMHALSMQQENTILGLFGASPAMIRRPLLYRGSLIGLASGIVSVIITIISISYLKSPLLALSHSYQHPFEITYLGIQSAWHIILSSMLLGWIGARIASQQPSKKRNKINQ